MFKLVFFYKLVKSTNFLIETVNNFSKGNIVSDCYVRKLQFYFLSFYSALITMSKQQTISLESKIKILDSLISCEGSSSVGCALKQSKIG